MLLTLTVAADSLKAVVPCALLSCSMVPFASCAIVIGGVSWVLPARIAQQLDNHLYRAYMRLCLFVFENLSGVEIRVHGPQLDQILCETEKPDNAVLISNHQSNVDWIIPVILGARHGKGGNEQAFRVMVKKSIHLVPMFGWYIFQHGYIYVRRFGDFIGEPVRKQLKWLDQSIGPFWLLVFPEGTRLSAKKTKVLRDSNEFLGKMGRKPMNNVLCPRSGGLQLALDNLTTLDAIYDVTIAYGQTRKENARGMAPGMFDFCCGSQDFKKLDLYIERYPIENVPREKQKLRNWLIDRFEQKERIIDEFYEKESKEGELLKTIEISTTLPSTLLFCAALIAPFYSSAVKNVYFYTITSSPLLIAWLHLRKCV